MKPFPISAAAAALLTVFLVSMPVGAAQFNTTTTLTDTEASSSVQGTDTKFTPAIDDLPLMPGLTPVVDENTLFIIPEGGRIAESTVSGPVDIDDVYKFYRHSLPNLGWKIVDARTYDRNGERLRIDAHADGKVTTVRFSVNPR